MCTNSNRLEALKQFLAEEGEYSADEIASAEYNFPGDGEININGGQRSYLVLTDAEADAKAAENIKNDLWAFNADFILQHTDFWNDCSDYEAREFIKALQAVQGNVCEGANGLVKALVSDMGEFITDAIDADGRGHFISWYDGEEGEARANGEYFYIYRID